MKRVIVILTFVLLSKIVRCQDITYNTEEYNALNDIILELIDTSAYYYPELLPLPPLSEMLLFSNEISNHENLDIIGPAFNYEPFDIVTKLAETQGDSIKIVRLYNEYNHFRDSIAGKIDNRKIVIYFSDSLFKLLQSEISELKQINKDLFNCDSCICKINSIHSRQFRLSDLKNIGRFSFSKEMIPDSRDKKELFQLRLSRIIFNENFSQGILFCEYYAKKFSSGETLLLAKKRNKWKIIKILSFWTT